MTEAWNDHITAQQGFGAMVRFLREYGEFFEDSRGVSTLLEAVDPSANRSAPSPPPGVWSDWLESIELAVREPEVDRTVPDDRRRYQPYRGRSDVDSSGDRLTALQGFDAMIRFLIHLSAEFPAADYFLMNVYYSKQYPDGELNTADPRTGFDWLHHVEAVRKQHPERP